MRKKNEDRCERGRRLLSHATGIEQLLITLTESTYLLHFQPYFIIMTSGYDYPDKNAKSSFDHVMDRISSDHRGQNVLKGRG